MIMSDLISRSTLVNTILTENQRCITSTGHEMSISMICNFILNQPKAYDVDAVVEELEEHKTQYGKLQLAHNDANMVCVYVGKEQAIDCAIEIVKAGGNDGR